MSNTFATIANSSPRNAYIENHFHQNLVILLNLLFQKICLFSLWKWFFTFCLSTSFLLPSLLLTIASFSRRDKINLPREMRPCIISRKELVDWKRILVHSVYRQRMNIKACFLCAQTKCMGCNLENLSSWKLPVKWTFSGFTPCIVWAVDVWWEDVWCLCTQE